MRENINIGNMRASGVSVTAARRGMGWRQSVKIGVAAKSAAGGRGGSIGGGDMA